MYTHVFIYIYIYIHMCVWVRVYMYINVYTYKKMYIYIFYIYIDSWSVVLLQPHGLGNPRTSAALHMGTWHHDLGDLPASHVWLPKGNHNLLHLLLWHMLVTYAITLIYRQLNSHLVTPKAHLVSSYHEFYIPFRLNWNSEPLEFWVSQLVFFQILEICPFAGDEAHFSMTSLRKARLHALAIAVNEPFAAPNAESGREAIVTEVGKKYWFTWYDIDFHDISYTHFFTRPEKMLWHVFEKNIHRNLMFQRIHQLLKPPHQAFAEGKSVTPSFSQLLGPHGAPHVVSFCGQKSNDHQQCGGEDLIFTQQFTPIFDDSIRASWLPTHSCW